MKPDTVAASFNRHEIQQLKREWQAELKLQDWEIDVVVVRASHLPVDHNGICNLNEKHREAYIMLRDARDANASAMRPYDMEVTLVHELLHCTLACFMGKTVDDHEDVCQEQAIHAHSKLLVRLRRAAFSSRYASFQGIRK